MAHIFGDEETRAIICLLSLQCAFLLGACEAHLMMARWSENILSLRLFRELLREDLALDVSVWSDIAYRQSDTLSHDFCIQVLTLDLLLNLARQKLDRVWIRIVVRLVCLSFDVAFVINKMEIVDDDCREVFLELILESSVGFLRSGWHRQGVTCDVHDIDRSCLGDVPEVTLVVHHVEGDVELLQLVEVVVLVEHLRMELEEFVASQIQTLQAADCAEGLEDHDWATHRWERTEVVAAEVELFKVLKVEHVVWELLQVVGRQVENAQTLADVEVADRLVVQLVVGQVEHLE